MAQDTNAGFTLPAQADAAASNTINNITNITEQVVMDALPVANTSTRDILIGGAVLIVLLIIFFILKNMHVKNLVGKKLSVNKAETAGWWLFLLLANLASATILITVNSAKFLTLFVLGPIGLFSLIALIAWLLIILK